MKKNYDDFCESIIRDLNKMGFEAQMTEVNKPQNQSYEGIMIKEKGSNMGPVMPARQLYSQYESSNYNYVFQELIKIVNESIDMMKGTSESLIELLDDYDELKKNVIVQVIPVKGNEGFLKEVPHKIIEDMAAIVRISIDDETTAVVRNSELQMLDVTADQFFEDVIKAGPNSMLLESMGNVLSNMLGINGPTYESGDTEESFGLCVLTNEDMYLGAGLIAYPEVLEKVAKSMCGNYYIIPSSIHEVLIFPDHLLDPESVISIIKQVNETAVSPEDKLSDNLYYYDAKNKQITTVECSHVDERQIIREFTF